jgi:hypothetical protein
MVALCLQPQKTNLPHLTRLERWSQVEEVERRFQESKAVRLPICLEIPVQGVSPRRRF